MSEAKAIFVFVVRLSRRYTEQTRWGILTFKNGTGFHNQPVKFKTRKGQCSDKGRTVVMQLGTSWTYPGNSQRCLSSSAGYIVSVYEARFPLSNCTKHPGEYLEENPWQIACLSLPLPFNEILHCSFAVFVADSWDKLIKQPPTGYFLFLFPMICPQYWRCHHHKPNNIYKRLN